MKLLKEFKEFLKEYKIVSLALAFIIGTASTSLVRSLVDNIIMPFIIAKKLLKEEVKK